MANELRYPDQNFAQLCGVLPIEPLGATILRVFGFSTKQPAAQPIFIAEVAAFELDMDTYQNLLLLHVCQRVANAVADVVDVRVWNVRHLSWYVVFTRRNLADTLRYIQTLADEVRKYHALGDTAWRNYF